MATKMKRKSRALSVAEKERRKLAREQAKIEKQYQEILARQQELKRIRAELEKQAGRKLGTAEVEKAYKQAHPKPKKWKKGMHPSEVGIRTLEEIAQDKIKYGIEKPEYNPPKMYDMVVEKVEALINTLEGEIKEFDSSFMSPNQEWVHRNNQRRLIAMFNVAISEPEDRIQVAANYEANAEKIAEIIDRAKYDSDQQVIEQAFNEFAEILQGRPLSQSEAKAIEDEWDRLYDQYLESEF